MKAKDLPGGLILRDLAVCPERAIDSVMGIDVQQEVTGPPGGRGHSRGGIAIRTEGLNHKE